MVIQVVTFNLAGLDDAAYRAMCDGLAPELAAVPGLVSKVWLADEATNTYGGVYAWIDRAAMDAFADSAFFRAFATNPSFVRIASAVYDALEGPSVVTRTRIPVAA